MESAIPLPQLDRIELKVLEALREGGGSISRTDLRGRIGGSNTTFMKKIEDLKEKGLVDEFKSREVGGGRMKTAYGFTEHASRLFELEGVLKMKKWFSASEKIELFPEFDRIARALIGDDFDVYRLLGISPQHLSIETIVATSAPPKLSEEQMKELLPMVNAYLQNVVTSRLHPKVQETTEGCIIFRYRLEQPHEELERELLTILTSYLSTDDSLEQSKAIAKLTELGIKNPEILSKIVMVAANVATSLKFKAELRSLKSRYSAYRRQEEPMQLTRIQLVVSVLSIFKKLHSLYHEERGNEIRPN